jgi:hypothetical protein
MITIFFSGRKLIPFDILPKGIKANQLALSITFSRFAKGKCEFSSLDSTGDFWVHMGNSLWNNGSKVGSRFEKRHISRLTHPPYLPDISPGKCWLFGIGMLKGVLRDGELNSSDEIEKATPKVCNELTLDEVQSVFHNWMSRLAWVIGNRGR